VTDKDPKRKASFLVGRIRIPSSETRQVGLAFAIPGLLLAGPLVGYGFGWLANVYLGAPEWARVIGLALGFVSGVRESILAVKRLNEEQEKDTSSHD
jgi:F0F1-type ATP synthase assembly protein I